VNTYLLNSQITELEDSTPLATNPESWHDLKPPTDIPHTFLYRCHILETYFVVPLTPLFAHILVAYLMTPSISHITDVD